MDTPNITMALEYKMWYKSIKAKKSGTSIIAGKQKNVQAIKASIKSKPLAAAAQHIFIIQDLVKLVTKELGTTEKLIQNSEAQIKTSSNSYISKSKHRKPVRMCCFGLKIFEVFEDKFGEMPQKLVIFYKIQFSVMTGGLNSKRPLKTYTLPKMGRMFSLKRSLHQELKTLLSDSIRSSKPDVGVA